MNNSTTCLQAVEFYLQQIEAKRNLNAYVDVYAEEALQKAKELDEKRRSGEPLKKLHGVVIGIKDVICYKGHEVTAASHILEGFTATYNATAVERLLAEDAIIIGSLNCDEFAMGSSNENSFYGATLNAIDESRVPGGSSGGSAVAVQADLCMVSLGSDTGGSVRQPADFCGIVGLKPTYGRISRYGLIAYASSFDQIGIFAKNIPDIALTLEIMAGADDFDSTVSLEKVESYSSLVQDSKPLRIAYFKDAIDHPSLDEEMENAMKSYLNGLSEKGHLVTGIDFDFLEYIVPAYYVLTTAEASSNLSRFDGVRYGYRVNDENIDLTSFYSQSRSQGFGKEVKRRIMLGTFVLSAGYFDAYFTQAQKVRKQLYDQTQLIFRDFDVIILPTVPSPAFKFGEKSGDPTAMYLADIYTVYANLVGIPAISLPVFTHSNGMPFGVQAMTNQFCELSLLQFSHQVMQQ
ncbi:Asp-tRNA(Asn)/Glu-tRNA(Gln) amidotransferase subunit GatA [Pinibacter soli]|uniref:Glutamyl-tRNA(Gln) amidotransferase subunit A n=1 Tax=Pinibacter soli TaxID=3044211 RepID=A0ABT6RCW9_9BACT|nr:Asp-tRNA(Asn)/Glu-tRNA(Gln) amidotransferase subunit GatA [Pinibacter soli]MDI3320235.1 Asp-tRNA(Asn)/Glu-tRNA(Gln) amidotransferase subunit GatA [Pinibacter soli]